MNELQWIIAITYLWMIATGWLFLIQFQKIGYPRLRGKRICLLIAHPDDEAMFFAPTLLALTDPSLDNHFKIVCLSSGDADGLGATRKTELIKSTKLLGLRREDEIYVFEDEKFRDSMTSTWDPTHISDILTSILVRDTNRAASQPPPTTTDVLITFDRDGVSSHPNHRSLYHGAMHFLDTLMKLNPGCKCPIALYTLTSTSWIRKYASILDLVVTINGMILFRKKSDDPPTPLFFVNCFEQYRMAQSAMTLAHKSQMRWFRWGWIVLSRYMVINDLKLERID